MPGGCVQAVPYLSETSANAAQVLTGAGTPSAALRFMPRPVPHQPAARHILATHRQVPGAGVPAMMGESLYRRSERLGHVGPVITLQVYAHVLPGSQRHAAELSRRWSRGKFMTDEVRCTRCGRSVDIDSDEFAAGVATDDGQFICGKCATREEELLAEEHVDEVLYEREAWRFDE
jgi:hypothetical protein